MLARWLRSKIGTSFGSFADRLRVPDAFVTAIEAALGQHLQLVLTEAPETAEQIIAGLSANRKGVPVLRHWR